MQYVQPTSDRGELVTIADLGVDLRVGADMGRRGSKRGSIRGSFFPSERGAAERKGNGSTKTDLEFTSEISNSGF